MSTSASGVEVKRVFIGAGCNRIVNNVSWGACGLVSFGAQNAVAIYCPKVTFCFLNSLNINQFETHFLISSFGFFDRVLRF